MSENTNTATKQTWLDKALTVVENVCNKLPDPVILFCWLFLFTAIIGTIATVSRCKPDQPGIRRGRCFPELLLGRRTALVP